MYCIPREWSTLPGLAGNILPHGETEMNEHKPDFRRLCLVSVVLLSVSAAKELECFQFVLFFGIGAVVFELVQQIQYDEETAGSNRISLAQNIVEYLMYTYMVLPFWQCLNIETQRR